ncbi:cyclic-phosphate processing receiver domain-containing protein [Cupriavidus necator]|uniref:cyclic-phosphate processing receiver domain-containing protein n=1 Tax=Cupriavidus necator TaxID=106590 RepID=UPI003F73E786
MEVYLDDERPTPAGWTRVQWPSDAIALLETGEVTDLSLDHDLGDDERGTGYDVILWIEAAVALRGFIPPRITVHSANASAAARMRAGILAIERGRRSLTGQGSAISVMHPATVQL